LCFRRGEEDDIVRVNQNTKPRDARHARKNVPQGEIQVKREEQRGKRTSLLNSGCRREAGAKAPVREFQGDIIGGGGRDDGGQVRAKAVEL
jgi:hypothetical protein